MKKVKVSFIGAIKKPWPEQTKVVEVNNDCNVKRFLMDAGYTENDLKRVAAVINGKRAGLKDKLKDGDEVVFVLLAGGG